MNPLRAARTGLLTLLVSASVALPQAPDRSKAPAPGPTPSLHLPAIQRLKLGNGIPVLLVELHKVPLVEIHAVVRAGVSTDPAGKSGLAHLTAAMLDRGAGSRTALEISDTEDYLGAQLEAGASWDSTTVELNVLVARLSEALALLADEVRRPTFPAEELERVRKELVTELLQWHDQPATIARVALARALYGEHPYGRVPEGTEASVRSMAQSDLKAFHAALYRPGNLTLVVVGDTTPAALLPRLDEAFGSWKAPASAGAPAVPAARQVRQREVWLVDKPGAAQSEIRIGRIGPPRATSDYFPLVVMNTILGGSFTSRLNHNLRETHGYTYGAGSRFEFRLSTGPFFAGAAVQTDKTGPALTEFFKELEAIRKPIGEEELQKAKNYLALRYPSGFETTGEIAGKLKDMVLYDLPADYFESYVARVQAVTAGDVERVARQFVDPGAVEVIVVGDRKKIEGQVGALKLGRVRDLSVEDILGRRNAAALPAAR